MLHASGLPKFLWSEAAKHGIWCKNRTGTKALGGKSPYEAFHDEKPNLSGVPQWGCRVWVHDPSQTKLSPRAREGRWVGYDATSNGSHIYWPNTKSLTVERSIYFDELRRFEGERSVEAGDKTTATDAPADSQQSPITPVTISQTSPQQPPLLLWSHDPNDSANLAHTSNVSELERVSMASPRECRRTSSSRTWPRTTIMKNMPSRQLCMRQTAVNHVRTQRHCGCPNDSYGSVP